MNPASSDRLPDAVPAAEASGALGVRMMRLVERLGPLDALERPIGAASAVTELRGWRGPLRGAPLGHAAHPWMTDVPIGLWSSSLLLDVLGHPQDRPASRRLLAAGLLSAVPTVLTGLAEWRGTARPESRVASAHAGLNLLAIGLYAGSLALRGRSHRGAVGLSFGATTVATCAGLLGGHLATARKVGSRDPSYATDGVGPVLSRNTPLLR
jgi:uncharacterized membrane protein